MMRQAKLGLRLVESLLAHGGLSGITSGYECYMSSDCYHDTMVESRRKSAESAHMI
jgi:hypothetical protein